jgi:hypothetical protein
MCEVRHCVNGMEGYSSCGLRPRNCAWVRQSALASADGSQSFEPTGLIRLAMAFDGDERCPTLRTQQPEVDTTRATASLPGLDIEIVHRWSLGGDADII